MRNRRADLTWVMVVCLCLVVAGSPPWLSRILFGARYGVSVCGVPVGGMLASEVRELLVMIAPGRFIPAEDASLDKETGKVVPERRGAELDVHETLASVLSAPKNAVLDPAISPIDPLILSSDLERATTVIGTYTTSVGGSENRAFNVGLATSILNMTVVPPGGLFSFNEVVGPRTYALGFRPAPVLVSGGTALDAGGGVCQVSSTLYNAVLEARLEVAERSPHSKPVRYVPPGRDATVAYPYIDLKFINSTADPIIVRGQLNGRSLRIWITGVAGD